MAAVDRKFRPIYPFLIIACFSQVILISMSIDYSIICNSEDSEYCPNNVWKHQRLRSSAVSRAAQRLILSLSKP